MFFRVTGWAQQTRPDVATLSDKKRHSHTNAARLHASTRGKTNKQTDNKHKSLIEILGVGCPFLSFVMRYVIICLHISYLSLFSSHVNPLLWWIICICNLLPSVMFLCKGHLQWCQIIILHCDLSKGGQGAIHPLNRRWTHMRTHGGGGEVAPWTGMLDFCFLFQSPGAEGVHFTNTTKKLGHCIQIGPSEPSHMMLPPFVQTFWCFFDSKAGLSKQPDGLLSYSIPDTVTYQITDDHKPLVKAGRAALGLWGPELLRGAPSSLHPSKAI